MSKYRIKYKNGAFHIQRRYWIFWTTLDLDLDFYDIGGLYRPLWGYQTYKNKHTAITVLAALTGQSTETVTAKLIMDSYA